MTRLLALGIECARLFAEAGSDASEQTDTSPRGWNTPRRVERQGRPTSPDASRGARKGRTTGRSCLPALPNIGPA